MSQLWSRSFALASLTGAIVWMLSGLLLILDSPSAVFAAPVISNVQIADVRASSFTVAWTTDVAVTGTISYGNSVALGSVAFDDRGSAITSTTHHVTISGLTANTLYYFDVVSGSAIDNNGGNHYTVTSGPSLAAPSPNPLNTVYGQVFKRDGTSFATGAIVYIIISDNDDAGSAGNSQILSALVDSSGYWNYNLGNARTLDLSNYFVFSPGHGDKLLLVARGGIDGNSEWLNVDTSSTRPSPNLNLTDNPTAVILSSFRAQSINDSASAGISLFWNTASEIHTAGFNLYRSERPDGPFAKINANLIPAALDPLSGGSYSYEDTAITPGQTYYYELEDVEVGGNAIRHTPIATTAASGSIPGVISLLALGLGLSGMLLVAFVVYIARERFRLSKRC